MRGGIMSGEISLLMALPRVPLSLSALRNGSNLAPQNCYLNNAADLEATCATPQTAGMRTTNHASATFTRSAM